MTATPNDPKLMSFRNTFRVATGICFGALLGLTGAWLVWNFVYSIGSRVIKDEHFAAWESSVAWSGCGVGAFSALLVALLSRFSLGWLLLLHVSAALVGCCGATVGWRAALIGYFSTIAVGSLAIVCSSLYARPTPSIRNASPGVWRL